jgi:hypothetical protein
MSTEVNTPESVPDVPLESTPEGVGADESQIQLEKLNELLGKDFKDVDTALKSVKDTFNFVGKRDEISQTVKQVAEASGKDEAAVLETLKSLMTNTNPPAPESSADPRSTDDNFISKEQYIEDKFFDKNPELESIKDYIKPLKQTNDQFKSMSWDEFAKTEQVSKLMETFSGYDEATNKKSVVESNPRIGAITDKLTRAKQALEAGDVSSAKSNAVSAVMDSFGE